MAEYLAPGVFIEEIERGPKPIEGVATSTSAFLGATERGPVQPRLVTSYSEYLRLFGGVFAAGQYMPHAVNAFFDNGGRRAYICRITGKDGAGETPAPAFRDFNDYRVEAIGPESWGGRIFVKIRPSTTQAFNRATNILAPIGIRLQIAYWPASVVVAGLDPFPDPGTPPYTGPRPSLTEVFDDVVLDDPRSPNHYSKRIGDPTKPGQGNSSLINFRVSPAAANVPPQLNANPPVSGLLDTDGADGGAVTSVDYEGDNALADRRTGLSALLLDQYREVALVYAPNASETAGVEAAIVSHCENQRFRFAVIDVAQGQGNFANLDPRSQIDTQYAAFYYPWLTVNDPQTGAPVNIPPGGAVLGIYARSDTERGVFKAPANETVRGALDLEYKIDERGQEVLNPRGVNVIRQFPGRGIRVWGARTLSSDTLWKYVPVRRLFIFLERSIYEGTQWVVFEPNDERLWARVKDTIRLFLRTQFRAGALMGATEAEAFRITCDRTVMTQDDILNGRLVCEIGIAPVRPAEFVIFRIFQLTAEAQT